MKSTNEYIVHGFLRKKRNDSHQQKAREFGQYIDERAKSPKAQELRVKSLEAALGRKLTDEDRATYKLAVPA